MADSKDSSAAGAAPASKSAADGATGRKRRTLEQVAGSTSSLLAIAIVLMVNYLAFRNYERIDWTSQGMYTLSGKSKQVLAELGQDIDVYLFMARGETSYEDTDELLKRYQAASAHVKVHHVDPEREPAEFRVLAQRFKIGAYGSAETGEVSADVAAVVALGDKTWHVDRDDLVAWDLGTPGDQDEYELNVKAEQALTGAIVQVTSGRPTKVCVTTGHGEWSLDEGTERSLAPLKDLLRNDNIEWQGVDTLGQKALPEGCDAVMVLGPVRAFSEAEAKLILDYVAKGGNALLALDPVIEADRVQPTGFEAVLLEHGVRLDQTLVMELDETRLLSPNPLEFFVTSFGDHVTTRPLTQGARIAMLLARSLSVVDRSKDYELLLRTSEKGFGETNIAEVLGKDSQPSAGPDDVSGPVDLAVALRLGGTERPPPREDEHDHGHDHEHEHDAEPERLGGRLMVVGDSDFLQLPLMQAPELANAYLISAFTGWLTEREALIAIPPKKVKGGNIAFTQADLGALFLRVCVLLPGAALLLGVAIWLNRRS